MNDQPKNYGLKLDEFSESDYVFGASPLPMEVLRPDGDWQNFLPLKEAQNLNNIEPYACVSFTTLNAIEILIKQKYNEDTNWSDRFLAAISGTKEGGNSPSLVAEFIRKVGLVAQELWPFDNSITSFEQFYAPVPPKLYELAKEFNDKWIFRHEFVPPNNESITQALKCSPLGISVSAWFQKEGIYYRPEGMQDNHFTTLIAIKDGVYKRVFDSYDSFIKDYDWAAPHAVIKRFYIEKRSSPPPILPMTFYQRFLGGILGGIRNYCDEIRK